MTRRRAAERSTANVPMAGPTSSLAIWLLAALAVPAVAKARNRAGAVRELADRLIAPTAFGKRLQEQGWRDRND